MQHVLPPDSLMPGDIIGPWQLELRAGRGAYGVVFRARRAGHPLSEPVALKLALSPEDPRFAREVTLLSRIQHPAVPKLVDRGWWRGEGGPVHPYIVMQWADGLPLYTWAEQHPVSSLQVLSVLAQVARALEATHDQGCLHRDVKGDNMRVAQDGTAFLMDYGAGTWQGAERLTEGTMAPDTRAYRSPEALRFYWASLFQKGLHYQASTADDVYALGVAMYRVATGAYPPPGTDLEARENPRLPPLPGRRPPQVLNPRVVPELSALIERMLADKPQDRPSARKAAEAAEAAMKRAGPQARLPLDGPAPVRIAALRGPVRGVPAPPVPTQEWRPGRVTVVGVALLGVSLLCVANWQSPPPPMKPLVVSEVDVPPAEGAQDGGTADLGDTAMTAQAHFREEPVSSEVISLEMPEHPLPGQRQAPCSRTGEVEINGGCWKRWADVTPPCDEGEYEWKGACYVPVLKRARRPTSKQP